MSDNIFPYFQIYFTQSYNFVLIDRTKWIFINCISDEVHSHRSIHYKPKR